MIARARGLSGQRLCARRWLPPLPLLDSWCELGEGGKLVESSAGSRFPSSLSAALYNRPTGREKIAHLIPTVQLQWSLEGYRYIFLHLEVFFVGKQSKTSQQQRAQP